MQEETEEDEAIGEFENCSEQVSFRCLSDEKNGRRSAGYIAGC